MKRWRGAAGAAAAGEGSVGRYRKGFTEENTGFGLGSTHHAQHYILDEDNDNALGREGPHKGPEADESEEDGEAEGVVHVGSTQQLQEGKA